MDLGNRKYERTTNTFNIYPNPTSNRITIEVANESEGAVHLKLFNINGQQLINKYITGSRIDLDISFLQQGIYFITLQTRDEILTKKFIKK